LHDSICTVNDNGIEFIDDAGAMEGYLTILFGMAGGVAIWFSTGFIAMLGFDILTVIMLMAVVVCALVVRCGIVAYRFQPVIFYRSSSKVHVFVAEQIIWWKLWQLKQSFRVESFDWSCLYGAVRNLACLEVGAFRQNTLDLSVRLLKNLAAVR
jgi:hypothetical protein